MSVRWVCDVLVRGMIIVRRARSGRSAVRPLEGAIGVPRARPDR